MFLIDVNKDSAAAVVKRANSDRDIVSKMRRRLTNRSESRVVNPETFRNLKFATPYVKFATFPVYKGHKLHVWSAIGKI